MVMIDNDRQVQDEILTTMRELADDWEYSDPITQETRLMADLGMESLELVILGVSLQQRYGQLPFNDLLIQLGERPVEERDLTVGELVGFVCRHQQPGEQA